MKIEHENAYGHSEDVTKPVRFSLKNAIENLLIAGLITAVFYGFAYFYERF